MSLHSIRKQLHLEQYCPRQSHIQNFQLLYVYVKRWVVKSILIWSFWITCNVCNWRSVAQRMPNFGDGKKLLGHFHWIQAARIVMQSYLAALYIPQTQLKELLESVRPFMRYFCILSSFYSTFPPLSPFSYASHLRTLQKPSWTHFISGPVGQQYVSNEQKLCSIHWWKSFHSFMFYNPATSRYLITKIVEID